MRPVLMKRLNSPKEAKRVAGSVGAPLRIDWLSRNLYEVKQSASCLVVSRRLDSRKRAAWISKIVDEVSKPFTSYARLLQWASSR